MKLLLDTHIAIWAVDDLPQLGAEAVRLIESAELVSVSAVSVWEIAIKHARRRGRLDDIGFSGRQALRRFRNAGFALLPITPEHAVAVDALPPIHGDPFDRLLVAQARTEPMHLLTRDSRLAEYGTLVVPV